MYKTTIFTAKPDLIGFLMVIYVQNQLPITFVQL